MACKDRDCIRYSALGFFYVNKALQEAGTGDIEAASRFRELVCSRSLGDAVTEPLNWIISTDLDELCSALGKNVLDFHENEESLAGWLRQAVRISSLCGRTTPDYPECLAVYSEELLGSGVLVGEQLVATVPHVLDSGDLTNLHVRLGSDVDMYVERVEAVRPSPRWQEGEVEFLVLKKKPQTVVHRDVSGEELSKDNEVSFVGFGGNVSPIWNEGRGCKREIPWLLKVDSLSANGFCVRDRVAMVADDDSGGPCYVGTGENRLVVGVAIRGRSTAVDSETFLDSCFVRLSQSMVLKYRAKAQAFFKES